MLSRSMMQFRALVLMSLLAMALSAAGAADPAWYVRKISWQESLFASREDYARRQAVLSTKVNTVLAGRVALGDWWDSGPLKTEKGFDTVLPPETGALPTSNNPDENKAWKRQSKWRDGAITGLKGGNDRTVYLYRTLTATEALKAPAYLGCDDRMSVWLNGKKIFTSEGYRGVAANQDKIDLALRKGENTLLMKVFNKGGNFAFYFSMDPEPALYLEDDMPTLWRLLARDFGDQDSLRQMHWEREDKIWDLKWDLKELPFRLAERYAKRTSGALGRQATKAISTTQKPFALANIRQLYYRSKYSESLIAELKAINLKPLRLAIEDLAATYPDRYDSKGDFRRRLAEYEKTFPTLTEDIENDKPGAAQKAQEFLAFRREALLANPLLDFDKIMIVKRVFGDSARKVQGGAIGAPGLNSHTNNDISHTGWDNEIVILSNLRGEIKHRTLYRPEGSPIVRDVDLDFDADRIMFSSIGANDLWALMEIDPDGKGLRQLTPTDLPDVDFFDSCYLPDGRIIACSTASYQGLPCESGGRPMVNLYLIDPKTQEISQLTFEQDSDYHPCVLNSGRVLYMRWEYSDIMHYFSRIMFSCNPDGTNQLAYYGSGSYFPTAFKHARPCPTHPRKIVGIIGGHHATSETGRMGIIDPGLARKYPLKYDPPTKEWGEPGEVINLLADVLPAEKTGFVQEIPGYGKDVVGNVRDGQGTGIYPNFVYPYPLNDNYFLVSMKPSAKGLWGLYLVDIFDNMLLLKEEEGAGYFEAFPFTPRTRPPLIPDRVIPGAKYANVLITDIYSGPGLKDIPRGKVKNLRLFAYHFAYNRTGGHAVVGVESSWDIKRILGTVPVETDGSVNFQIPANTPISIQPLDADGAALQLMRSWFVGKPGENVSCTGCHEQQNQAVPNKVTIAAKRPPTPIVPWHGEARPYAYPFEVQPLLEEYCIGCHDGETQKKGSKRLSFTTAEVSYKNLHPFVRRPGPESDMALLQPMEYHASTSPLVQMLKKGHHNVRLDPEAWERLYCWIDLNAPYHGSWNPGEWRGQNQVERRQELAMRYAGLDDNPEATYDRLEAAFAKRQPAQFIKPARGPKPAPEIIQTAAFPLTTDLVKRLQVKANLPVEREIDLGEGVTLRLVPIPVGEFIMGDRKGYGDESPRTLVRIERPFWMGVTEITNAQYARFDPKHDTRYYDEHGKDHAVPGYIGNHRNQPVARVSWLEAQAFCQWLSAKTNSVVSLPTEAQWEWAARAGTASAFYYGDLDADFSEYANLSDITRLFTKTGWDGGSKIHKLRSYDPNEHFPLRDDRSDDKSMVTNYVAQYKPNAWGLHDTIGNVSEWTLSSYRPYPYNASDGRNDGELSEKKVARGGSWHDRPKSATASVRQAYEPYQKVFNVGFRIMIATEKEIAKRP